MSWPPPGTLPGQSGPDWRSEAVAGRDNKTQPTDGDVRDFLQAIEHEGRREDALVLLDLLEAITGHPPVLWGSILGFGRYHYVYDSGHEGDMFLTGFAPRKANLVLYIMPGFNQYADHLARLGRFKTGKSCLYIGRLKNVDLEVLRDLIALSVEHMREKYGVT